MDLTSVGIFTLNWRQPQLTINCVKSLLKAGADPSQLFIIDNGSGDNSLREFQKKLPKIRVIPLKENLGFGGGFNAGLRQAGRRFDFYLITNNDTLFERDSLSELVRAAESKGKGHIYHPVVLLPRTQIILSGGMLSPIPSPFQMRWSGRRWSREMEVEEVPYLSGCCFLVPRKLLEKLGGIREDFFLYGEDADLGLRARKLGAKIFVVPRSRIYHSFHGSSGRFSPLSRYYIARNTPRIIVEHRRGKAFELFKFYLWGLFGLIGLLLTLRWKAIWAYLRGTIDFFKGKTGKVETRLWR